MFRWGNFLTKWWKQERSGSKMNCYILNSHLEENDVTAHGGKIVYANLGSKVFVGFNAFSDLGIYKKSP
jgi:hypothetical protein